MLGRDTELFLHHVLESIDQRSVQINKTLLSLEQVVFSEDLLSDFLD